MRICVCFVVWMGRGRPRERKKILTSSPPPPPVKKTKKITQFKLKIIDGAAVDKGSG